MKSNILDDIKTALGPSIECDDGFDSNILTLIDIALLPLAQVGCLKDRTESINEDSCWSDIINPPCDAYTLSAIKKYVYINVKIIFDPPVSTVVQIMQDVKNELLWRITEAYEKRD